MKYIYAVTETDVDGCGSMAREFVSHHSPLTENEKTTLSNCLDESKQKSAQEDRCLDTEEMVLNALNLFEEKTGIHLNLTADPITDYFEF